MKYEFSVYDQHDQGPAKFGPRRLYKGGGGGGTSVSMPAIPDELKPLANQYTQTALKYANTPYQAYGGQRYADLNQNQNSALQMIQNRAQNGSATMNNAEGALNQFIQGGNTNPYLDRMVSKAQGSVAENYNLMTKPQMESAMVNSGSFGNSGLQQMQANQQKQAAQQMSDISTQMYGNAYGTDQANRMQAIGMSPTFGNAAYQDASQLLNAGNTQQNQAQNNLDFAYQQFQNQQDYPVKQLGTMSGVIGQNMGQTTTQTSNGGGK